MEILIVILLLVVIAALVFAVMRLRPGAAGGTGLGTRGGGVRGARRARAASRHDPMATAVERHSAATDPHEAAEEELRLRAQANRVASELHAREAAALESQAGTAGPGYRRHDAPVVDEDPAAYADRRAVYADEQPVDEYGRPVYADEQPVDEYGRPVVDDDRPVYHDERGRPVYEDERPRY